MEKTKVALVPCTGYETERVFQCMKSGITLLGGLKSLLAKEERILLKPNLLRRSDPAQAIVTHPAVLEGMVRLLAENGYQNLSYGDSPGTGSMEKAASRAGMTELEERFGIRQGDFSRGVEAVYEERGHAFSYGVCPAAMEADAIINLCKMKTHALQRITGAVKNLYGCIYGLNKSAGHVNHPDPYHFAEMLVRLHKLLKPRLHIMDGIVAMEGNGPAGGEPVNMNLLLFSTDPVALDAVFAALVGLPPASVPAIRAGEALGLGKAQPNEIQVVTPNEILDLKQAFEIYGRVDFKVFRGPMENRRLGRGERLIRFSGRKPVIRKERCIACGICVESCPVPGKAVTLKARDAFPHYRYRRCIRCYCCQELCPENAIDVKLPFYSQFMDRTW